MPWSAVTYSARARRQLLGEALDEPVDVHELAAPGVGVDAESVALAVDLGVVRVDQRAVAGSELLGGEVHALLAGEPSVERAAAERDLGQRGVLERRGTTPGRCARPPASASWKTVGYGCQTRGCGPRLPAELVHQLAGRRVAHGVAGQTVRAGRQAGADGGERGRGGGREAGGERAAGAAARGGEQRGAG